MGDVKGYQSDFIMNIINLRKMYFMVLHNMIHFDYDTLYNDKYF